jgi:hypothetical protein
VTPSLIVALLFWSMLVFAAATLVFDKRTLDLCRSHWKPIVLILIIAALWRLPWNGVFFHGLEYEDSYIYTVAGRQMADRVQPLSGNSGPPLSFNVCAIGSIRDCDIWEPFPEHLIGYPYVISMAARAFSFTPAIGSFLNLFASLVSALLVFLLALTITGDSLVALLAGLAFAVIPVFAVYGLETSAEPFSCCCVLLALWFFLSFWRAEVVSVASGIALWCAYTATLLFSQTVKREDLLLALLLPLTIPFVRPPLRKAGRQNSLWTALVAGSSLLAIILSWKMQLWATSQNEQELLHQFTLTPARLAHFIGSFLASFWQPRWYGGSLLAVLLGSAVAVRKRGSALIPLLLLISFILVYAIHIRGYYEMESGQVAPESALRFSMNLMGLWAIVAGLGIGRLARWAANLHFLRSRLELQRYLLLAIGALLLLASGFATFYLRRDAIEDEANSRVTPAIVAAEVAAHQGPQDVYILTMNPLVIQMYANSSARTVDLESVDDSTLDALVASDAKLIFLKQDDRFMDADLERYGEPIRRVLAMPSERLDGGDGFSVSLIEH